MSVQRRTSMPQELEDPEDFTGVSEAEGDLFGEEEQLIEPTVRPQVPPKLHPLKEALLQLPKEVRNILAGGIAGMVAKSIVAPLDRIKILYQVSSAEFHFRNIPKVAKNIIQEEGLPALWKGNTATLLRVFPYSGIQFMVFDWMKTYFLSQHERDGPLGFPPAAATSASSLTKKNDRKFGLTPEESLVSGMLAGTISVMCTYPLDLARAQLAVMKRHKHSHNRGFAGVIADNYGHRGIAGLFRGLTVTMMGILPYSGIAFALNEQSKREIQNMAGRDLTTIERMQCGAFAGLVAQTVTYPIEVTRRRMQTIGLVGSDTAFDSLGAGQRGPSNPPSLLNCIRSVYSEQGIHGFFKGVSVNWLKGPIAFSISFTTFDTVQGLMESETERQLRLPHRFRTSLRRTDT